MAKDAIENRLPSLHLLQAIHDTGRKPHLIYASSGGTVYGPLESHIPFKEIDLCHPAWLPQVHPRSASHDWWDNEAK